MKESKIDAMNTNKTESEYKIYGKEDKNVFHIFSKSFVNSIEKKTGDNDHSKA